MIHLRPIVPIAAPHSQALQEAFFQSCLTLDTGPFFSVVTPEDDIIFEDKDLLAFMAELTIHFDWRRHQLLQNGMTTFTAERIDSFCNSCRPGAMVNLFRYFDQEGNLQSELNLSYMLEKEEDILLDIYRCFDYRHCLRVPLADLYAEDDLMALTDEMVSYDYVENVMKEKLKRELGPDWISKVLNPREP